MFLLPCPNAVPRRIPSPTVHLSSFAFTLFSDELAADHNEPFEIFGAAAYMTWGETNKCQLNSQYKQIYKHLNPYRTVAANEYFSPIGGSGVSRVPKA